MQSVVAVIPKGMLEHIDEILAYNWPQEQQDFEECYGLYQDRNGKFLSVEDESEVDVATLDADGEGRHIFQRLFIVNEWLESLKTEMNKSGRMVWSESLVNTFHCQECNGKDTIAYYVMYPHKDGVRTDVLCLKCFQERMLNW